MESCASTSSRLGTVTTGGLTSLTTTSNFAEAMLPALSLARQETVVLPRANIEFDAGTQVTTPALATGTHGGVAPGASAEVDGAMQPSTTSVAVTVKGTRAPAAPCDGTGRQRRHRDRRRARIGDRHGERARHRDARVHRGARHGRRPDGEGRRQRRRARRRRRQRAAVRLGPGHDRVGPGTAEDAALDGDVRRDVEDGRARGYAVAGHGDGERHRRRVATRIGDRAGHVRDPDPEGAARPRHAPASGSASGCRRRRRSP